MQNIFNFQNIPFRLISFHTHTHVYVYEYVRSHLYVIFDKTHVKNRIVCLLCQKIDIQTVASSIRTASDIYRAHLLGINSFLVSIKTTVFVFNFSYFAKKRNYKMNFNKGDGKTLQNHKCSIEKCSRQFFVNEQNIFIHCFGCKEQFNTMCFGIEYDPRQYISYPTNKSFYFFKDSHVQFICFDCFHKLKGVSKTEIQTSSSTRQKTGEIESTERGETKCINEITNLTESEINEIENIDELNNKSEDKKLELQTMTPELKLKKKRKWRFLFTKNQTSLQKLIEDKDVKIIELTHKVEELTVEFSIKMDKLRTELDTKINELHVIKQDENKTNKSNISKSRRYKEKPLKNHVCKMEKCSRQSYTNKQNILVYCFGCEKQFFTQCFYIDIDPMQIKYFFKNSHVQFVCFACFYKLRGTIETKSQGRAMIHEKDQPNGIGILNDDCLENIFDYLKWSDLLHIADTSKQFYVAVCNVFKRNYKNTTFSFYDTGCRSGFR